MATDRTRSQNSIRIVEQTLGTLYNYSYVPGDEEEDGVDLYTDMLDVTIYDYDSGNSTNYGA